MSRVPRYRKFCVDLGVFQRQGERSAGGGAGVSTYYHCGCTVTHNSYYIITSAAIYCTVHHNS